MVVLRRNPYYFKVDESGQQLPYFNEMLFRLSTWSDRTAQAVAGTGDFSNMEDPGNYVEVLKQSQSDDSPVKANFGPRALGWQMMLNYSRATAEDDYDRALRTLFRETDFRLGLSHALDRDAIGQAVARGPFAYPFMGGLVSGSPAYDADSTVYRSFDQDKAKALFDSVGAVDTDGNGIRNLPGGGDDIVITVVYPNNRNEQRKQLDAMTSQLAEVGVELRPRGIDEANYDQVRSSGAFTARFARDAMINPTRQTCRNVPVSLDCPSFHRAVDGKKDFLDFEQDIADAYATYVSTSDVALQAQAMRDMQRAITENAYVIGTIQVPAALLVNKRIKNAHPGTPVRLYEWAEDGVMRERLYTPAA
ncbi:MAG: ABC transporter substrate-binding protein, partial [Kiloniellales bacterium]|nr:ABC transporter substrate-binding protein [Kiloniellales bacterium]